MISYLIYSIIEYLARGVPLNVNNYRFVRMNSANEAVEDVGSYNIGSPSFGQKNSLISDYDPMLNKTDLGHHEKDSVKSIGNGSNDFLIQNSYPMMIPTSYRTSYSTISMLKQQYQNNNNNNSELENINLDKNVQVSLFYF